MTEYSVNFLYFSKLCLFTKHFSVTNLFLQRNFLLIHTLSKFFIYFESCKVEDVTIETSELFYFPPVGMTQLNRFIGGVKTHQILTSQTH